MWKPRWQGPGDSRELLLLAWPFILSNACWTLQITLDRILLGRQSSDAIAAALAASWLYWVPMNLLYFTARYAATFVAQYTGAGQPEPIGATVWQAIWFSVFAGVAFLGLVPLAGPFMALGGHEPQVQALEAAYFRCLCFATLPMLLTASATSFFAGRGDSRTVLLVNVVGLSANVGLAYPWIFGLWGFPAWGITGAGWATVAGSSASAILSLGFMLRRPYREAFGTGTSSRFDFALFCRLLYYGIPSGAVVALDTLAFTVFLVIVGWLGSAQQAAASIAFTLSIFSFLPALGIAEAVAVLVGQRLGENRPDLAARTTWTGCIVALVYMILAVLPFVLMPGMLTELFHAREDGGQWERVAALVPALLGFVALYSLFDSVNLVFSFALRGAGDTLFVTTAAFCLAWPVMVLPTFLAWHFHLDLRWAWCFVTLYVASVAAANFLRFRQGKWRSMRVIETHGSRTVPAPPLPVAPF